MKKVLLAASIAAVALVAAALAGVLGPEEARGQEVADDRNLITVSGSAFVTAVPDRAELVFAVVTDADTAAAALTENAQKSNALVAAVTAAGVPERNVQTTELTVTPRRKKSQGIVGYTIRNGVRVRTSIEKSGAILDAAIGAGANTVYGPTLSLSDRETRYREALQKALADARVKAEALAKEGGFSVGSIERVVEGGADYYEEEVGVTALPVAAAALVSAEIQPGEQRVGARVSVSYAID